VKLEKLSEQDASECVEKEWTVSECLGEKRLMNKFSPHCQLKSGIRVLA